MSSAMWLTDITGAAAKCSILQVVCFCLRLSDSY